MEPWLCPPHVSSSLHSPQDSKERVQHSTRAAEPILHVAGEGQTFALPELQSATVHQVGLNGTTAPKVTTPTVLGTELS